MIVTSLKLANVRAIETAELLLQPDFNLLVGVNGVGKSTILYTLGICMSRILPVITESRDKAMSFSPGDIRMGYHVLDAELTMKIGQGDFRFTRRQWRQRFAPDDRKNIQTLRRQIMKSERLSDRRRNLLRELDAPQALTDRDSFVPSRSELRKIADAVAEPPNCVFFATDRSSVRPTRKSQAPGGVATAYAKGLRTRRLEVTQFAEWMRAQAALAEEREREARHLRVLQSAVERFLPTYHNLRATERGRSRLQIDRGGIALEVSQLSDGERGVLALVLDLARRLLQANPSLDDPLSEGQAVVLIDEIDLHLHPKWQLQIVRKLQTTFPRCQFIATTHSPQVVASVNPEQVHLLTTAGVVPPDRTRGMDSNWILRHLMEADDRPEDAKVILESVVRSVELGAFSKARAEMAEARRKGFDLPEWSILEARIARLEILAE